MGTSRSSFIVAAVGAGLLALAGDFLVTIVLGFFYPGYNHLQMGVVSAIMVRSARRSV